MIESLAIADVGTFGPVPERIDGLSDFNYFFGANGTGKTTISRVIANEVQYANCSVTWRHGRQIQTLVLNRDFVQKNFAEMRGVFTLGKDQKDTLEKIQAVVSVKWWKSLNATSGA